MKTKDGKRMGRAKGLAVLMAGLGLAAGLEAAGLADLFAPGEPVGEHGYRSDWFGEMDGTYYPWVAHAGLGWIYLEEGAPGTAWLYDGETGWNFTAQAQAPWLYRYDTGSWQFAYGEAYAGLAFYDLKGQLFWWGAFPPAALTVNAHAALYRAEATLEATVAEVASRTAYPSRTNASTGKWGTVGAADWTSGFWPGCLWLMHEFTGEAAWRTRAEEWTAGLAGQQWNTTTHDVGFMVYCSYGEGYRLTGNPDYLQVLLNSATSLDTRYSAIVKAYNSWSWGRWDDNRNFTVIADNMMNLELMAWASHQPGGKSAWLDHAIQHSLTTDKEHVRDDNSTYHVIVFDKLTGGVLERTTHQGLGAESFWARGQAWVLYGFVEMHAATSDPRMLDAARRTSDAFIDHLPADGVPPWDFDVANPSTAPRDSSAAAIAASALLKLAGMVEGADAGRYRDTALHILESLMSPAYQNGETSAVLDHGTAHYPAGSFDTGLIWGDYYFLEALLRYLQTP